MRILFVIHRFGADIIGGAERIAWLYAEGLAERGHELTVATTTAHDYMTWDSAYPKGEEKAEAGFTIRRFEADRRNIIPFNQFSNRMIRNLEDRAIAIRWMQMQGPDSTGLTEWVARNGRDFDAVILFNYLYYTSWQAMPYVADRALLVPFAHDEWPFEIGAYRGLFAGVAGVITSSDTEEALLREKMGELLPPLVARGGCWPPVAKHDPTMPPEMESHKGGDFLLLLGRQSPAKNTHIAAMIAGRAEHQGIELPLIVTAGPMEEGFKLEGESAKLLVIGRSVSEGEAAWLRQNCRASLHISELESLNLEALNGLNAGAPLLVNQDSHASAEIIENGAPGSTFELGNIESLKTAIDQLPDRANCALDARDFLAVRHDRETILNRLETALKKVKHSILI